MEPEVTEFLKKISYTIGLFILWMILNVVFGIQLQWGYIFNNAIGVGNIIYYIFLAGSLAGLFYVIYKMWRNYKMPL